MKTTGTKFSYPVNMPRLTLIISLFAVSMHIAPVVANDSADYTGMRDEFLAAERALKQGQLHDFHHMMESLQSYPLYPYLLLEDLRRRLGKVSTSEIKAFLKDYENSPLEKQLRQAWLASLARNKRWDE